MRVTTEAPYVRRGVTQLMYVGDDEAVEKSTSVNLVAIAKVGAVAAVAVWILSGISSRRKPRR
jgi:hypothetical protein